MDFAALPPEINSFRMYTGPGAGPMQTAAYAWQSLSTDLHSAAYSFHAVVSGMVAGPWLGLSAASMAAAAFPFVAWLDLTAEQAAFTANQARAAIIAYETALAMTVPPAAVAENRVQLVALTAANFLGQNTAAIAAAEAQYSEMWAQDATAMYSYACTSAAATANLPTFVPAPQIGNSKGLSAQSAALFDAPDAAVSDPATAQIAQPAQPSATLMPEIDAPALGDLPQQLPSLNEWMGMASLRVSDVAMVASTVIPMFAGQGGQGDGGAPSSEGYDEDESENAEFSAATPTAAEVTAKSAQASSVGHLSVPPAWAEANQAATPTATFPAEIRQAVPSEGGTQQLLGGAPLINLAGPSDRNGVSSVLQVTPRAYSIPRTPAAG